MVEVDTVVSKLQAFLRDGRDWERRKTTLPGVFLIRIPGGAGLAVEINPVDSSGQTKKRRGLMLRGYDDLEDFRKIINDNKLDTLVKLVDKVNPKRETGSRDTIEI